MKGGGVIISVVVVLAVIQLMAEPGQAAVSCAQVDASLAACLPYLRGQEVVPTPACCSGVKVIISLAAAGIDDKRACCNCVKDAANKFSDLRDDAAKSLPDKCKVKLDIPISRTTDCNALN